MDFLNCSVTELINVYSQTIKELKKRGVLRTKNVVGELGEFLVLEWYERTPSLPSLNVVPVGTKNINAISQAGDRYSIKSTTGNVTGVVYGLQPPESATLDKPLFEYMIICKLDEDYSLEGIYQLSWDNFVKHKRWHSRMNAWNIAITKAMKKDSVVIYDAKNKDITPEPNFDENNMPTVTIDEADVEQTEVVIWNKTEKVNHSLVRKAVVDRLQKILNCNFNKKSASRYVSNDNNTALFVTSASFSQKNNEYWYSIDDENIPWLDPYPSCYVAFALGSPNQVLLFPFSRLKLMLEGCLRTKEDPGIKKKAHYHISFAVEGSRVYFKKKLPEREFIEVSSFLK